MTHPIRCTDSTERARRNALLRFGTVKRTGENLYFRHVSNSTLGAAITFVCVHSISVSFYSRGEYIKILDYSVFL